MAEQKGKENEPSVDDQPGGPDAVKPLPAVGLLLKGLSQMTVREQQAVLVVLLLGLLGIGVKLWHSFR